MAQTRRDLLKHGALGALALFLPFRALTAASSVLTPTGPNLADYNLGRGIIYICPILSDGTLGECQELGTCTEFKMIQHPDQP